MDPVSNAVGDSMSRDPAVGLCAVAALRRLTEQLEDLQVEQARGQGWSWAEIANALGISKQAVHKKHSGHVPDSYGKVVMFERFTQSARGAVISAQEHARTFHHPEVGAEHLLLGTLTDDDDCAARALRRLGIDQATVSAEVASLGPSDGLGPKDAEALSSIGIDLDQVRRSAEETFGAGALGRPRRQRRGLFGHRGAGRHVPFAREARSALELSLRTALARGDNYIGTEHLLLGLLATEPSSALTVLQRIDPSVNRDAVTAALNEELKRSA